MVLLPLSLFLKSIPLCSKPKLPVHEKKCMKHDFIVLISNMCGCTAACLAIGRESVSVWVFSFGRRPGFAFRPLVTGSWDYYFVSDCRQLFCFAYCRTDVGLVPRSPPRCAGRQLR